MDLNKNNIKKILLIITFTILLFLGVQNVNLVLQAVLVVLKIISPFILGLCIAFIINVLLKTVEERAFLPINKKNHPIWNKVRRPVSLTITYLLIIGVVFFVLFLVIPELKRTIELVSESLPFYMNELQDWIMSLIDKYNINSEVITNFLLDWDKMIETLSDFLQNDIANFLNTTVNITTSIFSTVFNIIMGLVFSIYLLFHKESLWEESKRALFAFIPTKYATSIVSIGQLSNKIFSNFVTGQFTEALIIGFLCFIGMSIFSMPYPLIISVLVSFTALIPVFGAFIGTAIGAFLILMIEPMQAVWFVVFIIVLQQFEGNIIYPKVVGNKVGLPSLWVLLAVLIGGSTYGIFGMLLGVPIFSIVYTLFKRLVEKNLTEKKINMDKIKID